MKKFFNFALTACLMGSLSLGVTSCKDDDNDNKNSQETAGSVITVSQELLTKGIRTDKESTRVDVNIDCNGKWTGALDADASWVSINDNELVYDGKRTISLYFDENTTGTDRKTRLLLYNDKDELTEIPVIQFATLDGDQPDNSSGTAFAEKGVGRGLDYDYVLDTKSIKYRCVLEDTKIVGGQMTEEQRTSFDPTKVTKNNNIFNLVRIQELIKTSQLNKTAYVEAIIPMADLVAAMLDSALTQKKHLSAYLQLGVSFGPIEFEASAGYNSTKDESRAHVDYSIVRNAPIYNVILSEAELSTYANDAFSKEVLTEEFEAAWEAIEAQREAYYEKNGKRELTAMQKIKMAAMENKARPKFDNLYSADFGKRYWNLYWALMKEDYTAADQELNTIDNLYGPFYCSGGNFGGSLTMYCKVDTMYLLGKAKFEGALSGEVSGMFHVTGEFKYSEDGHSLMRNSHSKFFIYGGNANETAGALWALCMGPTPDDRNAWQKVLQNWVESMYSPEDGGPDISQAAPLSFNITPVWNLFADAATQEYAQNYFINKYKNRGIEEYLGIIDGKIQTTPEEHFARTKLD